MRFRIKAQPNLEKARRDVGAIAKANGKYLFVHATWEQIKRARKAARGLVSQGDAQ